MKQWKASGHKWMQTQQLCSPNCNIEEFLTNPVIIDFLIALSGQHRGGCFYNVVTDVNLPKNLWQITFGEELHPNIYSKMHKVLGYCMLVPFVVVKSWLCIH